MNFFMHSTNNYKYSLFGTHYILDANCTVMIETDILLLHSSKTLVKTLINLDERNRKRPTNPECETILWDHLAVCLLAFFPPWTSDAKTRIGIIITFNLWHILIIVLWSMNGLLLLIYFYTHTQKLGSKLDRIETIPHSLFSPPPYLLPWISQWANREIM